MIRIDGGFLILNYMKYRDRDYTGAERQRRYRERVKVRNSNAVTQPRNAVTSRSVTQAEAEAEASKTLRSASAGNLLPSSSERANGHDVLQKRETRKRSVASAVAAVAAAHRMPS